MRKVFCVGALSTIALEVLKIYAKSGAEFFLVGRNQERLQQVQADLMGRGAKKCEVEVLDVLDFTQHEGVVAKAKNSLGTWDLAFIAHGTNPDQEKALQDSNYLRHEIEINFVSVLTLLNPIVKGMKSQKSGQIAVITSVAADRGRQSNFIYGSAKAGLDTYLQGLRNSLFRHNIEVTTLRPGFVDSPLTAHMKKGLLFTSAPKAGKIVHKAIEARKDIVYIPGFWRLIMLVIKAIPEKIFKKLHL